MKIKYFFEDEKFLLTKSNIIDVKLKLLKDFYIFFNIIYYNISK